MGVVAVCALTEIPVLGARVDRASGSSRRQRRGVPHRRRSRVRGARPLPAQGRAAVAGHRVRRSRGLPAAQLDDRACDGEAVAPDAGCTRRFGATIERGVVTYRSTDATTPHARSARCPPGGSSVGRGGPSRLMETRSTCPYCGVGCGVVIEHDRAAASRVCAAIPIIRRISASCAQGPHAASHRAPQAMAARLTHPLARPGKGAPARRVAWDDALDGLADRFARLHSRARSRQRRLLRLGPAPDRGLLRLQQARQGARRHQQHRHQLAALHVERGRGLQADARGATRRLRATTTSTTRAACSSPAPTPRGRIRSCTAASRRRGRAIPSSRSWSSIRAAPRPPPRPTCTSRSSPGTDVALFHGMLHLMLWDERIDRDFIAAHTDGIRRAQGDRARIHAAHRGADVRHQRGRPCRRGALVRRGPDAVAVLPGAQPVVVRHGEERGARQPAPRDRADRQARRGAVLADGPAERDGRPRSRRPRQPPLRASRSRRSRASRRGGGAVGRRRRAGRARASPRSSSSTRWPRAGEDGVDRMHESRAVDARPGDRARGARPRRARRAAGGVRRHRDRGVRRRAAARVDLGREGRHRHQFRAAHLARSRSARAAGRSARGLGDRRRLSRAAWKRACVPGCRRCFPTSRRREVFAEHAESTRGRDLDITGLSYAKLDRDGPQQWPCREGDERGQPRACTPTAGSRPRTDARALPPSSTRRSPSASTRAIRSASTPGACATSGTAMSRTGTVAALFAHARRAAVELHPADLARRGFATATSCASNRAAAASSCPWSRSDAGRPGSAYLPMHWGSATLAGRDSTGVNAVTAKASCPASKQPELKHAAVRIVEGRAALAADRFRLSRGRDDSSRCATRCARCAAASTTQRRADRRRARRRVAARRAAARRRRRTRRRDRRAVRARCARRAALRRSHARHRSPRAPGRRPPARGAPVAATWRARRGCANGWSRAATSARCAPR